jgi:hypothetical protein
MTAYVADDQPGGLGRAGLLEPGASPQAVRQPQHVEGLEGLLPGPAAVGRSLVARQASPKSASRLASHLRASEPRVMVTRPQVRGLPGDAVITSSTYR